MNKIKFLALTPTAGAFIALSFLPASAQLGGPAHATAVASAKVPSLTVGSKGLLTVTLSVKPGFHVNANKPNDPAYIPTVFTPQPAPGIAFGTVHYPAAKLLKVSYSPKPLLVYLGQVRFTVPFTVTEALKPAGTLSGAVAYQACNAQSCFPPASAPVKAAVIRR